VGWAGCSSGNSASGGTIAATTEGAVTRKSRKDLPGEDGSGGVSDVSSPSVERCYAPKWGADEGVWATSDGGATWTKQVSGDSTALTAVDFVSAAAGFALGKSGRILRTQDGGLHWVKLKSGTTKPLAAVGFVDASDGWVLGSKGVRLPMSNGGRT